MTRIGVLSFKIAGEQNDQADTSGSLSEDESSRWILRRAVTRRPRIESSSRRHGVKKDVAKCQHELGRGASKSRCVGATSAVDAERGSHSGEGGTDWPSSSAGSSRLGFERQDSRLRKRTIVKPAWISPRTRRRHWKIRSRIRRSPWQRSRARLTN